MDRTYGRKVCSSPPAGAELRAVAVAPETAAGMHALQVGPLGYVGHRGPGGPCAQRTGRALPVSPVGLPGGSGMLAKSLGETGRAAAIHPRGSADGGNPVADRPDDRLGAVVHLEFLVDVSQVSLQSVVGNVQLFRYSVVVVAHGEQREDEHLLVR